LSKLIKLIKLNKLVVPIAEGLLINQPINQLTQSTN
jgi:hypothetical protein